MKKLLLTLVAAVLFTAVAEADTIILKDDQTFEARVRTFDSYYLVVELENKCLVNIPWDQVRQVKHTTTPSSWLEETYLTNEDVEVDTYVAPLDEGEAFSKAFFPGLIIHGSGHFYSKDQNTGMSLLSAEIVSVIIMGISINEILSPVQQDQSFDTTKVVFYTGLTLFVGSWLWDVIFSRPAVSNFNATHEFLVNKTFSAAQDEGKNMEKSKDINRKLNEIQAAPRPDRDPLTNNAAAAGLQAVTATPIPAIDKAAAAASVTVEAKSSTAGANGKEMKK